MLSLQINNVISLLRSVDSAKYAEQMLVLAVAYALPLCKEDDNRKAFFLAHESKIKLALSKINEFHIVNIPFILEQIYLSYAERVKISYFPWASGTSIMVDIYDTLDDDDIADWDRAMKELIALFKDTVCKDV